MRFRRLTAGMIIMLLALGLVLPGAISAQDKLITEVAVAGNQNISKEAVLTAVTLKAGDTFAEEAVQQSRQAIMSMGNFERVIVGTETTEGGLRVVFNVVENPVVKEIKFVGNTAISAEQLLALMRTSVGNVLNTNMLERDADAIRELYRGQGYIADVTEEIGIDPDTGVLTIPIMENVVESVEVTGNKKTKSIVILREMELKPGDVYNSRTLIRDLTRIYDLDFFEVDVEQWYKLEPGSEIGKLKVVIPLKEKKTGQVTLGVGYSSRQRLVGQAKVSETNFQGRGRGISALWEVGNTSRGTSYELGYYEPWLDARHTSLSASLYNKLIYRFSSNVLGSTGGDSDYDERRQGASITLGRPLSRTSKGFLTLRGESVDTRVDLLDPSDPDYEARRLLSQAGDVASATLRFTNNSRDSELDPVSGMYSSYALELGQSNFTTAADQEGDSFFSKYSVDFRKYFSKGGMRKDPNEKRRTIAVRLMVGSLTGKVPFFEQYFTGGAETLRGYKEDRFWGRNTFLLSTEYRFPVSSGLTGVGFVDVGDAWGAEGAFLDVGDAFGDSLVQHADFDPSVGYGVGIRVRTPIGPIRLDYGFGTEGSRAHFSLGHVF